MDVVPNSIQSEDQKRYFLHTIAMDKQIERDRRAVEAERLQLAKERYETSGKWNQHGLVKKINDIQSQLQITLDHMDKLIHYVHSSRQTNSIYLHYSYHKGFSDCFKLMVCLSNNLDTICNSLEFLQLISSELNSECSKLSNVIMTMSSELSKRIYSLKIWQNIFKEVCILSAPITEPSVVSAESNE